MTQDAAAQHDAHAAHDPPATSSADTIALPLPYHPPFDWAGILRFLGMRALKGVECVTDGCYVRTVQRGDHAPGWVHVRHQPERRALVVELSPALGPDLPAVLARLGHVFDLNARPDEISAHLAQDPLLSHAVARNPGLRVPGAFDGFELAVRAILGQQVTVRAATTFAGRFVDAFGEPITTPHAALDRLCPTSHRIAAATMEELTTLGIIRTRARSILVLAEEIASGRLALEAGGDPARTMAQLVALPGIGAWTAHYIAMRALRWPDAFPKEDVALRTALGGMSAGRAEARSQAWRPWRSYATLHLWQSAGLSEAPAAGGSAST